MRLLIYELASAGGLRSGILPSVAASIQAEGRAMTMAVATDFAAHPDCQVTVLVERPGLLDLPATVCQVLFPVHGPNEFSADLCRIAQHARQADWTLLIAPETDGHLFQLATAVVSAGGRLLGPGPETIALTGDKQRTADHLLSAGVPCPPGRALATDEPWPGSAILPAIWKPRDGCGSAGIQFLESEADWKTGCPRVAGRLETFVPGQPCSVAVLCGPNQTVALPACTQTLDRNFCYTGGNWPLSPEHNARAQRLAHQVLATLPDARGYLGVDIVLGTAGDGSEDYIIEINPRLTTSYVGLRAAAVTNLAAALLAVVEGRQTEVVFGTRSVRFSSSGQVIVDPQATKPRSAPARVVSNLQTTRGAQR